MAGTEQTEEKSYDRYGNLLVKRVLGNENEDIKYDKFSLYNMTSSYLKKTTRNREKRTNQGYDKTKAAYCGQTIFRKSAYFRNDS